MRLVAGGRSYEVTAEDKLWLLRAVQAEGAPEQAVAEALVNLHALRMAEGRASSLAALVRAYAQPVNPRWYESGDLFKAALAKAPTDAQAVMVAIARRRERVHSARAVFDPRVIVAVQNALTGAHATDVTDYAAPSVDATAKGYEPRSAKVQGQNRLWTRKPGWGGYSAARGRVAPLVIALALAAVTLAMLNKGGGVW